MFCRKSFLRLSVMSLFLSSCQRFRPRILKNSSFSLSFLSQVFYTQNSSMVRWCSGYHVCFTRRRSRVQPSLEPSFFFSSIVVVGCLFTFRISGRLILPMKSSREKEEVEEERREKEGDERERSTPQRFINQ